MSDATFAAVAGAKEAIAVLQATLLRLETDTKALADAVARFDHEAVLGLSLRNERTSQQAEVLEGLAEEAIGLAHAAPGGRSAIDADLTGLIADARRIGALRTRTAILIEKARAFATAHHRALLPTTTATAYGRSARAVVDTRFSSVRTAG